jgi:alkylation response protein AidB-like acyl-CoA dehydrogenase
MHTHLVATTVWRWRHGDKGVEPLLKRIAAEELILVSSGGSDWLDGSGKAERVDGGFRVTARKVFASGSPSGDLLFTTAVYDDPKEGPTVLHFPVSLTAPGVRVEDNWRVLGMRGTGSNDVFIEGVTIPETAIGIRRPSGKWHRFFDVLTPVAWPLVMSAYVGVVEAARELAVAQARKKREEAVVQLMVGELETLVAGAQMALRTMVQLGANSDFEPTLERSNQIYLAKAMVTRCALAVAEKAMEVAGGAAFFRSLGLERLVRDIQGIRYHPLQEKKQQLFAGRLAMGLDPI